MVTKKVTITTTPTPRRRVRMQPIRQSVTVKAKRRRSRARLGLAGPRQVPSTTPSVNLGMSVHGASRGFYSSGNMLYGDREYWGMVSTGSTNLLFLPGNSGLSRLDALASTFDLWRLKRAVVHFVTSSGTTQIGSVYMGPDYDPADLPTTQAGVMSITPLVRTPVWAESSLAIDPVKVNKTTWMYTSNSSASHPDAQKGFAACVWNSNTGPTPVGEIWLDYEVELSAPATSQTVSDSVVGIASFPFTGEVNADLSLNPLVAKNTGNNILDFAAGSGQFASSVLTPTINFLSAVRTMDNWSVRQFMRIAGRWALRNGIVYQLVSSIAEAPKFSEDSSNVMVGHVVMAPGKTGYTGADEFLASSPSIVLTGGTTQIPATSYAVSVDNQGGSDSSSSVTSSIYSNRVITLFQNNTGSDLLPHTYDITVPIWAEKTGFAEANFTTGVLVLVLTELGSLRHPKVPNTEFL